jgi:hypothetical protein
MSLCSSTRSLLASGLAASPLKQCLRLPPKKALPPESGLASIHAKVDRFVESPAIIVVVVAGGYRITVRRNGNKSK